MYKLVYQTHMSTENLIEKNSNLLLSLSNQFNSFSCPLKAHDKGSSVHIKTCEGQHKIPLNFRQQLYGHGKIADRSRCENSIVIGIQNKRVMQDTYYYYYYYYYYYNNRRNC